MSFETVRHIIARCIEITKSKWHLLWDHECLEK